MLPLYAGAAADASRCNARIYRLVNDMSQRKIMVLAGGPDREAPVSVESGKTVSASLREAGYDVLVRDIGPANLAALDEFARWGGDAIFPALHGGWGEGGGLQAILDARKIPYVGCRAPAASLCMDKILTKQKLASVGAPTLPFEVIEREQRQKPTLPVPHVIKGPREGSSIDVVICKTQAESDAAVADLFTRHPQLLVEQFCKGKEITVGVIDRDPGDPHADRGPHALPPIHIVPAAASYDFAAKYTRDDTRYVMEPDAMGLTMREYEGLGVLAVEVFKLCGCRHMSRIDFIVEGEPGHHNAWLLEVNTIPGFTSHSLLPKAAAFAGIPLPTLVDRLVRLAIREG